MIKLLKYILLGIIQGITEPLPISSSGHVYILKHILNLDVLNDLNFEIIVNAGSLLAIMILYKDEIFDLINSLFKYGVKKDRKYKDEFLYGVKIILGVIPIMICGLLFKDNLENKLSNINIVGCGFLITSILLFACRNKYGSKRKDNITIKDCITIGLVQIIALIPGISRSGTTYIAGINNNIERNDALKYSFMMYIPISIGTIILGLKDLINSPYISALWIPYFIGFVFSFITSFFSLKWFIGKINSGNLKYFSLYCLLIGLIVLIFM